MIDILALAAGHIPAARAKISIKSKFEMISLIAFIKGPQQNHKPCIIKTSTLRMNNNTYSILKFKEQTHKTLSFKHHKTTVALPVIPLEHTHTHTL